MISKIKTTDLVRIYYIFTIFSCLKAARLWKPVGDRIKLLPLYFCSRINQVEC